MTVNTIDTAVRSVVCPTCGCSLIRLGLSRGQATHVAHNRMLHFFCCDGCAETFRTDPNRYLARVADVVVCPGCLGEKPIDKAIAVEYRGRTVYFCECPYCLQNFKQDPEAMLARIEDW